MTKKLCTAKFFLNDINGLLRDDTCWQPIDIQQVVHVVNSVNDINKLAAEPHPNSNTRAQAVDIQAKNKKPNTMNELHAPVEAVHQPLAITA